MLGTSKRNGIQRTEVEILSQPESEAALLKVAELLSRRSTHKGKVYICFRSKALPSAGYVYGQVIFRSTQEGFQVESNELKMPAKALFQFLSSNEEEIASLAAKRKELESALDKLLKENRREDVYLSFLAVSHLEGETFPVSFNLTAPTASYSRLGTDEIDLIRKAVLPYPVSEIILTAKDLSGV